MTYRARAYLEPGITYIVAEVGAECPLEIGERVASADRWTFDLFTGATETMDIRREDGSVVTISRGARGAVFTVADRYERVRFAEKTVILRDPVETTFLGARVLSG